MNVVTLSQAFKEVENFPTLQHIFQNSPFVARIKSNMKAVQAFEQRRRVASELKNKLENACPPVSKENIKYIL